MSPPPPQEHAQQVAQFRAEIIGALVHRALDRGQLQQDPGTGAPTSSDAAILLVP